MSPQNEKDIQNSSTDGNVDSQDHMQTNPQTDRMQMIQSVYPTPKNVDDLSQSQPIKNNGDIPTGKTKIRKIALISILILSPFILYSGIRTYLQITDGQQVIKNLNKQGVVTSSLQKNLDSIYAECEKIIEETTGEKMITPMLPSDYKLMRANNCNFVYFNNKDDSTISIFEQESGTIMREDDYDQKIDRNGAIYYLIKDEGGDGFYSVLYTKANLEVGIVGANDLSLEEIYKILEN